MSVSFFNKVAALRSATLLKKRLCHWCFPVNFAEFRRKPFFTEQLRWLLLEDFDLIFLKFRKRFLNRAFHQSASVTRHFRYIDLFPLFWKLKNWPVVCFSFTEITGNQWRIKKIHRGCWRFLKMGTENLLSAFA